MYKLGDKVKVISENECYNSFNNEVLYVTHIANNIYEHPLYDDCMEGMQLLDLETEDGEPVSCSLYECEVEPA